ncbi:hypothetical protein DT304_01810 [Lactobacillus reuteri]|nr:hypothetical protein [Limosilactobacillus reuteri]
MNKFRHILWPPRVSVPMLIWSVVWLILDRMHEYTNWLNSISSYLFITYVLGIFLIYIIGTIANEVKLFYQIKNLE